MTEKKLSKSFVLGIYAVGLVLFLAIFYILQIFIMPTSFEKDIDYTYVNKTIFEEEIPVVSGTKYIIKPYLDNNVKKLKGFYDINSDEKDQENAIIEYDGTYMPSTGIIYGGVDSFDVVSILDGKVLLVDRDDILGYIIHIEYANNVIGIYEGISDIKVNVGDTVKQGSVIAKSGTSNLTKKLGSSLLFELIVNSTNVNPEDYYDKSIDEL